MNTQATILIVDDEPFNVDYLEQELVDRGYSTLSAATGSEALATAATNAPDVILLDIMMPGMDGFEVLSRLKADETLRHIPVIIISAMSDMDSVIRGINLGAEDYLPKPFEPVLLEARLKSSLDRKRLHDAEQTVMRYMANELEIGRRIQAGFLPAVLPEVDGWEIAVYFKAAREVAGDFYDVFRIDSIGRLAFVLGDVCDKGVGSALYMALFRSLLRVGANLESYARKPHQTPDAALHLQHIVTLINNYIAEVHGSTNMFATLFFGLLDPATGSLLYINAGQEPPLLLDGSQIRQLQTTGPVVGLFADMAFEVAEVVLSEAMCLAVISDGVTEAQNARGELLELAQVEKLLLESPTRSAAEQVERIVDRLQAHAGEAGQSDDISILVVRRLSE